MQNNYQEIFGDSLEEVDTNIGKIKIVKNISSILLGTHLVLSTLSGVAYFKDPKLIFNMLTTFNATASFLHGTTILGTSYLLKKMKDYRLELVNLENDFQNKILKKNNNL